MKRVLALLMLFLLTTSGAKALGLTEADGLSCNRVWCCMQDNRGYLWIGTDTGLDRYDGARFKSFGHTTRCLAESEERIWAGTEEGLWSYSHSDGTFLQFKGVTRYGVNIISRVNDIAVTEENTVWVGTEGQGLFQYNTASGELIQHSIHTPFVEEIFLEPDGRIIVTDNDGHSHLYSSTGEYIKALNLSRPPKSRMIEDKEGTRWIPTDGEGLIKLPGKNTGIESYPIPDGISSSNGIPLTEDQDGNIIIGLRDKLYFLNPEDKQYILIGTISPHGNITRLLNSPEGLWLGTDTDCIVRYSHSTRKIQHYHTGGNTNVMFRTQQGEFMAGTSLGVFFWDPVQDRLLKDLNRRDIQILIDGEKSGNSSYPKEFEVVSQSSVVAMCEDASGHYLYLATSNRGVFRKNLITKGWEHMLTSGNKSLALPWNKITTLRLLNDGTIVAGTDGEGLWAMPKGDSYFSIIPQQDPRLRNSKISCIAEDGNGKLWIVSSSGLWRVDRESGISDSHPVKAESIIYSTDGKLYLGSRDAVISVSPQSMTSSLQWPNTVIQELIVGDSTLYVPPGGRKVTISYPQNSFSVSIAALSFTDPTQNLYSWRLEGLDSDWSTPSSTSTATYTKVRPGDYVFRARGSEDVLRITVRPPWWIAPWAIALYCLLGVSFLTAILLFWQKRIKHRYNEMMKRQEEEREKALYKQRIRFFIGLVHEIRTPLTLIRLQHEKDAPGKNDAITRNLDYMQETLNRVLTYDKNASGDIRMLKTRLDMRDVAAEVVDTFREGASMEGISINAHADDRPIPVNADEDMLIKILTNLLSNALKYTRDMITVTVTTEGDDAVVSVSDNGPGVREDQKKKIFDMFYTAPDDKVAESSGIGVGLAYARQLALAHDGNLYVENAVPRGASFVLRVPLLKEDILAANDAPATKRSKRERLSVLVVEDNRELRQTINEDLSPWYDIFTAPNGSAAMDIIEDKEVDVVVSDVMMPVMNGFDLCRMIKGNLAYSHIPVILLTAKVSLDAKSEGMESGADAYVEKPFTVRQLRGQIDNLIRLREAFRQSVTDDNATVAKGPEGDFIRAINESIDRQLGEESFSIEALASDMAMSRTNFFRKFKALTGDTPNDYLKNYRLSRAAELIRNGARINEAAETVGFTSSSYFAKCFKARFGVLPKDYNK